MNIEYIDPRTLILTPVGFISLIFAILTFRDDKFYSILFAWAFIAACLLIYTFEF